MMHHHDDEDEDDDDEEEDFDDEDDEHTDTNLPRKEGGKDETYPKAKEIGKEIIDNSGRDPS